VAADLVFEIGKCGCGSLSIICSIDLDRPSY
jgi:hypothetical protein